MRNRFAYRIVFVHNGSMSFDWLWNLPKTITYKHTRKDVKVYNVDVECIRGNTILWYYGNPNPVNLKGDIEPTLKDTVFTNLFKSTIIEKIVTAESFMQLFKILLIASIVIGIVIVIFEYIIFKKPTTCNLIVNNITMLTGSI
jgi:hypothetical protein